MADILLKVDPGLLNNKSSEISTVKGSINAILQDAKTRMDSLSGIWSSQASDTLRAKYAKANENIQNIFLILDEYMNNLTEIAGIYTKAETDAQSKAEGLPVDGVFNN